MNETEGLNLKIGPALIATNGRPESVNETTSQSPVGVFFSVVTFEIFESAKSEQYNVAASFASLSYHK